MIRVNNSYPLTVFGSFLPLEIRRRSHLKITMCRTWHNKEVSVNNTIISKGRIILAAVLSTVLALSVPAMKMEVKADNSPSITSASFDEKTAKVKFVLDGDGYEP